MKITKPQTSIIQNKQDSMTISREFPELCRGSRQINIAVAFALATGARQLTELFRRCKLEPERITITVGTAFDITEPGALTTLLDYGINLRVFKGKNTYHPKVYCFEHAAYWDILIGSANLSAAAFTNNIELMIYHRALHSAKVTKELKLFFSDLEKKSALASREWIAQYESTRKPRPYRDVDQKGARRKALSHKQGRRGNQGKIVKLLKKKGVPFSNPSRLQFKNKVYVFTGNFDFGTQWACVDAVTKRGADSRTKVTKKTDYLVVGTGGNPNYYWKTYGRKIDIASRYFSERGRPLIITENRFRKFA